MVKLRLSNVRGSADFQRIDEREMSFYCACFGLVLIECERLASAFEVPMQGVTEAQYRVFDEAYAGSPTVIRFTHSVEDDEDYPLSPQAGRGLG
jgi:hypothetical protein